MPQNQSENDQINARKVISHVLRNVFKGNDVTNPPWPRMILCAVATLIPLLVGYFNGQIMVAIFGGLTGYLLALNDHLGTLKHRMWVTTLSALILSAGFYLGQRLQNDLIAYIAMLGAITYWLGLLGERGAELERAVLFAMVGFITAFETKAITTEVMDAVFFYSLLAYMCLMLGGPIVYFIRHDEVSPHAGLRRSFRESLTLKIERHVHAVCFTVMGLISVWYAKAFQVEHGAWITITVLILLRRDPMLTIYKVLQRFLGTIAGVLIADLIVFSVPPAPLLIFLLGIGAFVIPWAMLKNYWLTSFLVTIFVVLILELGSTHHGSLHVGTLRIQATFIGCILSVIGVGLTRTVDRVLGFGWLANTPRGGKSADS